MLSHCVYIHTKMYRLQMEVATKGFDDYLIVKLKGQWLGTTAQDCG